MAFGVLRAARRKGLRVPEDLSVVGVDDHEMAALFDLTTVRQPVLEQGRLAARHVLRLMAPQDSDEVVSDHVELGTELVVRGTTGPAPAAASEPVSAFQIRKTDTGSDASAKPPPPATELTAASPVKNYHPKQSKPAS